MGENDIPNEKSKTERDSAIGRVFRRGLSMDSLVPIATGGGKCPQRSLKHLMPDCLIASAILR